MKNRTVKFLALQIMVVILVSVILRCGVWLMLWLSFVLCALVIVYSGSKLSKYGDIIAEKIDLGKSLVGVILLASVTSLPELVTGVSAVSITNTPDIAVGDVLGSCVFNLFILAALLDAFNKPLPISARAHHGHILSAACGILLLSITIFTIIFPQYNMPIFWVGTSSILFVVIYLFVLNLIGSYEKKQRANHLQEIADDLKYKDITLKRAVLNYTINSIMVVVAATFLPKVGVDIANSTGLGQAFVGNVFIAFTSSLPEVVVSIAAVRMGSVDLAIGNIFGSNIFNIFILFIDDIFFTQGPLLSAIDQNHIISALSAIIMTSISIIGLTYRADKKTLLWGWDSVAMIFVFIINMGLLYCRI